MNKLLLEVCCGSAEDVIEAWKAGADRIELNSNLFHGGLTPTVGSLLVAKRETKLPVMTMVRPREGGFCYTGNGVSGLSGGRGGAAEERSRRVGFRFPDRRREN